MKASSAKSTSHAVVAVSATSDKARLGEKRRRPDSSAAKSTDASPLTPASQAARAMGAFSWMLGGQDASEVNFDDEPAAVPIIEGGITVDQFYKYFFERRAFVVRRRGSSSSAAAPSSAEGAGGGGDAGSYYPAGGIRWSTAAMRNAIVTKQLRYGTDVNVVRFDKTIRKRVPLKTEGIVDVADYDSALLRDGWSVRFLRPQEHDPTLSDFMFLLDEAMCCNSGVNSYWTPPGSQGFAPHYDDVDVFLLQLEGTKMWKVYAPPTEGDELCRYPSEDYDPKELPAAPLATVELKVGDLLYMPRGFVHQGFTLPTQHSLHVTFSGWQMHTYADMLLSLYTTRIERLAAQHVDLRRGLPRGWWEALGGSYNSKIMGHFAAAPDAPLRQELLATLRQLSRQVTDDMQTKDGIIDRGADAFAKGVIWRRQPPPKSDKKRKTAATVTSTIAVDTCRLRPVAPRAVRVIIEEEDVQVVHCVGNGTICLSAAVSTMRFDSSFAPALVHLVARGRGDWVALRDLPMPDFDDEEEINSNRLLLAEQLLASGAFESQP